MKYPELFKYIYVMQQPSACQDEIIMLWLTESMMKLVPRGIWQRGLLACSMTPTNKLGLKLAQILPCWILGGLTPV